MEKILLCRAGVSRRQGFRGSAFRPTREFQPGPFPSLFITSVDVPHRPGDVEHVRPALLGLGNQPQSVAAERMGGKKKIEHKAS
jgi:hypothetical protein